MYLSVLSGVTGFQQSHLSPINISIRIILLVVLIFGLDVENPGTLPMGATPVHVKVTESLLSRPPVSLVRPLWRYETPLKMLSAKSWRSGAGTGYIPIKYAI